MFRARCFRARRIRFEIHREDLPGCPDLVFPELCTVVFVHGCYWHWHDHVPPPATEYWRKKLWYNKKRDERSIEALERQGWKVLVIWECENPNSVLSRFVEAKCRRACRQ